MNPAQSLPMYYIPPSSEPPRPVARSQSIPDPVKIRKIEILKGLGVPVEVLVVHQKRLVCGPRDPTEILSLSILTQLQCVLSYFALDIPYKRIRKLEYVWNDALYRRFSETKEEFRRWGKPTAEWPLFHGTAPENTNR
jgi:hypothetical protein